MGNETVAEVTFPNKTVIGLKKKNNYILEGYNFDGQDWKKRWNQSMYTWDEMPLLNFFAIVILSVENKILLQEKMKELRRLRTRYQPGKENASKNKADTQLAIANRIIQQSN